jgi:hypothetical protein
LATAVRVGFTLCRVLAHKVGLLSNRNHFNPPLAVADFAASRKYSQPRLRRLFHGLEAGATTRFACLHWNLGKPLSHFEILTAALSGLIYRPRMCVTGFLTRNNAGNFAGQWKLMSERVDLFTYLTAKLNNELLTSPAPSQVIHQLVSTADGISDEHFNRLRRSYRIPQS